MGIGWWDKVFILIIYWYIDIVVIECIKFFKELSNFRLLLLLLIKIDFDFGDKFV